MDTDVDGEEGVSDALGSVGGGTGAEHAPDNTDVDGGECVSNARESAGVGTGAEPDPGVVPRREGVECATDPSNAEVAGAVTMRRDEPQGAKGNTTLAGMTHGGGEMPAHGEMSGEIGAEPPMAGEGPTDRKGRA